MKDLLSCLSRHTGVSKENIKVTGGGKVFECFYFYLEVAFFEEELHILYLCAYAQGDGYGRTVVEAVFEYCRATGRMPRITCVIDSAMSFWQHMGFVEHPYAPDHLIPEGYVKLVAAA